MEQLTANERDFERLLQETRPLSTAFHASGFGLFLVGGIVRDVLARRQRPTLDIDLTTDALPDDIERLVRRAGPRSLWLQGKRFGTIGATFSGADGTDRAYEITTHRSDEYDTQSRKPTVAFSSSIVADLSRRDFTINAIAVDTATDTGERAVLIDPFGGEHDLGAGVLRTPVDPTMSFSDDPLRMLRAARFLAGFGLRPTAALQSAAFDLRNRLRIISAERVRDEFTKLLLLPRPGAGIDFLATTQLLSEFMPELDRLRTDDQRRSAVTEALPRCSADVVERLCVLLILGGEHATMNVAERLVRTRLTALRFSTDVVDGVGDLLRTYNSFMMPENDRAVREFVRAAGPSRHRLLHLIAVIGLADQRGAEGLGMPRPDPDASDRLAGLISDLERKEGLQFLPAIDGDEVMAHLGVGPGRHVGEALAMLADVRMERGLVSEAEARQLLDRWWRTRRR